MRRNEDIFGHGEGCPCMYCQDEALQIRTAVAALFNSPAVRDMLTGNQPLSLREAITRMREDLRGVPRENIREVEFEPNVGEGEVTISVIIIDVVY